MPPRNQPGVERKERVVDWQLIPLTGGTIFLDLYPKLEKPPVVQSRTPSEPTPRNQQAPLPTIQQYYGTAFLVDSQHVVSANHVISGAEQLLVRVPGVGDIPASVAARDSTTDSCLLKLDRPLSAKPLAFSEPQSLRVGELAFLVGFPLESLIEHLEPSITGGLVAGLQGLRGDLSKFQLTAQSNPGNSGGPVFDASGNVIGVLLTRRNDYDSLAKNQGVAQGMNFALKSDVVRALLAGWGATISTASDLPQPMTAEAIHSSVASRVYLLIASRHLPE